MENSLANKFNEQFKKYSEHYINNLNYSVFSCEKEEDKFKVAVWGIPDGLNPVKASINGAVQIPIVEVAQVEKLVDPMYVVARIKIPVYLIETAVENPEIFKNLASGILNDAQKSWEQAFGSYKKTRYGDHFFKVENLYIPPRDDFGYMTFTGLWADTKGTL